MTESISHDKFSSSPITLQVLKYPLIAILEPVMHGGWDYLRYDLIVFH